MLALSVYAEGITLCEKENAPVEVSRFEDLQDEFMARVSRAVYCALATIDHKDRPRSRVMHPIWDGSTGWVISWPGSPKAKHLARNPAVSLAYIADTARPVYVDAVADWSDAVDDKQRIWELYRRTPPPLRFDPQPHYGTIENRYFGLLRLTPWRIELASLDGEPIIWRQREPSPSYTVRNRWFQGESESDSPLVALTTLRRLDPPASWATA